jgi:hypothetical protein
VLTIAARQSSDVIGVLADDGRPLRGRAGRVGDGHPQRLGDAAEMSGHEEQGLADPPPARAAHAILDARRGKRGEARLPPAVAVLVAIALYAVLPEPLLVGPRFLIPGLELGLLVVLIATNPWRLPPADPLVPRRWCWPPWW